MSGDGRVVRYPASRPGVYDAAMTAAQYAKVAGFVEHVTGIRMPEQKLTMAQTRLMKRVRDLGMPGFGEYLDYAFDEAVGGAERSKIIDALTTNKTAFFREADHFDLLTATIVPRLKAERTGLGSDSPLRVWSAGCATGEEAYSIAMTLADAARLFPPLEFSVYATDICREALEQAVIAVYDEGRVDPVPPVLRRRYLLRSKDRGSGKVRVVESIRDRVTFARMNLLTDLPPFDAPMDVVFCRNVLIYFSPETQALVLRQIGQHMRRGSYLLIGHAETLHGMDVPFDYVGPTVYRRK